MMCQKSCITILIYLTKMLPKCIQCFQKPLFEDAGLTTEVMTVDFICKSLDNTRSLCNIVATSDLLGLVTMTGINDIEADENTYVMTGGTDEYAGASGKVISAYDSDLDVIINEVCFQE